MREKPPLAAGRTQWVFEHPGDPSLIVKVPRPDSSPPRPAGRLWVRRLFRRFNRYGAGDGYLLEIKEHFAAHARHGSTPACLQKWRGVVDTDLGLGMVFQPERAPDGGLAPSLTRLLKENRFDAAAATALRDFLRWLLASPVAECDLKPSNIVYVTPSPGEPTGHFVLIDGVGDRHWVCLGHWFPFWNRRQKIRHLRRFLESACRVQPASAGRLRTVAEEAARRPLSGNS